MTKIMMIEDDVEFAALLSEYMTQFNIEITNFAKPHLIENVDFNDFECVILDLGLPGRDGLDICEEIRAKSAIPIIISSARSAVNDKVSGLKSGADDYVPKPYDPKEMHARVMSQIRRSKLKFKSRNAENSAFEADEKKYEIRFKGQLVRLTPGEFEVLNYLIKNHGFAISRAEINKNCKKNLKGQSAKSIDVMVGRIRAKLGDSAKRPKHLLAVRSVGYKLIG